MHISHLQRECGFWFLCLVYVNRCQSALSFNIGNPHVRISNNKTSHVTFCKHSKPGVVWSSALTQWWLTSAPDFTIAFLYKVSHTHFHCMNFQLQSCLMDLSSFFLAWLLTSESQRSWYFREEAGEAFRMITPLPNCSWEQSLALLTVSESLCESSGQVHSVCSARPASRSQPFSVQVDPGLGNWCFLHCP